MQIRLATPDDLSEIMLMIAHAKEQIAAYGSDQWQNGYPNDQVILEDILTSRAFVGQDQMGHLLAYTAVIYGNETAYNAIYEGQWQNDNQQYVTFHRIVVAKNYQGQGLAQLFLQGLIEDSKHWDFRCDTHEKNVAMQALLMKLGYAYCGKVPLDGVRLAYQKLKEL
ncbi:N-acetyltransferase family protein [Streptococcus ictaluri]|uniref:Acetyltransferase, GNAT family n=1 Tax=Streptococcus ictaluri 707-05 TaxID=764299 RepID=G5K1J4_9STRE|nr:GNAT family N-acetyltransferase [Streptococcus ictaluri]EHI70311.1 acetyltransferase, GNAT family [Streptococcus ictaluri 707-05]